MSVRHALVAALALVSCNGDRVGGDAPGDGPSASDCPTDSWVTWENFAEPVLTTWCLPCHSSALPEPLRQGAPLGVDFDGYDEVVAWGDRIVARTSTIGDMPPVAGPTDEQRALLAEWWACGAPSPPAPAEPGPCDVRVTVAGDSDGTDLCAAGNALEGTLTVTGGADLSCLCEVGGDVVGAAGDVRAPLLDSVGGSLLIGDADSVELSALRAIGGSLSAEGSASLHTLRLPALESVGGEVAITDDPTLSTLEIDRLATVGGSLRVERDGALGAIDLAYLSTVAGDLVLSDLPVLTAILNTQSLLSVDGDITLTRLDALSALDLMATLDVVGGSITVAENPALVTLAGFDEVLSVGGDVVFSDNAEVALVAALISVQTIGGRYEVARNPSLETLAFLPFLASVGAIYVTDDPRLDRWDTPFALTAIDGDLDVSRNSAFELLIGFGSLASIGGDLRVEDSPALNAIVGFDSLATVGGEVSLLRLSSLTAVEAFDVLTEAGDTRVEDAPLLPVVPDFKELARTGNFVLRRTGITGTWALDDLLVVDGSLVLDDNPDLTTLTGLFGVSAVAGDLVVTTNPLLPTAEADSLAATIPTIGGAVVISGNAP